MEFDPTLLQRHIAMVDIANLILAGQLSTALSQLEEEMIALEALANPSSAA